MAPIHLLPEDLITGAEAAAIAHVTEAAVRKAASRGKLHRFPGRRRADGTLYARPEVQEWAAGRRQTAA